MRDVTEHTLAHLLRKRYPTPEWAFMCQVRNATGFPQTTRYADAMAFNLYPSRGLEILGFEIKVARADWLKEKDTPDKAEPIARHCDRWWIVAPNGIVRKDELPAGWGLMEVEGGTSLKITKDAPKLTPVEPKKGFWMSVMRGFAEQVDVEAVIRDRVRLAKAEGIAEGRASVQAEAQAKVENVEKKMKLVEERSLAIRNEYNELSQMVGHNPAELRRLPLKEALWVLRNAKEAIRQLGNLRYVMEDLENKLLKLPDVAPETKAE